MMDRAVSRASFFDGAESYSDYLCAQVGAARLLVKTVDKHIGRAVFIKGGRGDIKTLRRSVIVVQGLLGEEAVRGRSLIDVGANIGTTTIPALLSLPFATAVALEPEFENFLTLRLNLLLNGVEDRAEAIHAAASNRSGEIDLVVDRTRSGKHWIAVDETRLLTARPNETPTSVPCIRLDSLIGRALDPERAGLLWIDAENHEGQILEGASELLRRGTPVVFEWDREGLDRRGDRSKIHEIVNAHFTHFADMRASSDRRQPRYQLRAAEELHDYAHVNADGQEHFTEILALRLRKDMIEAPDLDAILKGSDDAPGRISQTIRRPSRRPPTDQGSKGRVEAVRLRQQLVEVISSRDEANARLVQLEAKIVELEARQGAAGTAAESSNLEAVPATKLERTRQQAADVRVRIERLDGRRQDVERRLATLGAEGEAPQQRR
jgi:FkbM family methyltransferase